MTSSAYDDNGNKITATDAKSETTTYAFDARGRQVSQTDRLAGVTEFAYTGSSRSPTRKATSPATPTMTPAPN